MQRRQTAYSLESPASRVGGLLQVALSPSGAGLDAALHSVRQGDGFVFWIADEGVLYPEALHYAWRIPLSRVLLVQARDSPEVWRTGLEAVQTGIFSQAFLRACRPCPVAQLRKLQLVAEKLRCEVFLLTEAPLPHWTLKRKIHAHPVYPKPPLPFPVGGKRVPAHPQSFSD